MGTDFDWQTEEEQPQQPASVETIKSPTFKSHHRRWLLGLLLLLSALAYFGWRELQEYVADAETAVKEEVRSSHELAEQAAAKGDTELFRSMLSGRDDDWTEAQLERVEQGFFFTPILASAGLQPLIDESQIINIGLDPQYREATLLVEQPYVATDALGFATTITLQQTYIYRRGAQRWLLSPPEPSFWGQQSQIEGALLTLDYPQPAIEELLGHKVHQFI